MGRAHWARLAVLVAIFIVENAAEMKDAEKTKMALLPVIEDHCEGEALLDLSGP